MAPIPGASHGSREAAPALVTLFLLLTALAPRLTAGASQASAAEQIASSLGTQDEEASPQGGARGTGGVNPGAEDGEDASWDGVDCPPDNCSSEHDGCADLLLACAMEAARAPHPVVVLSGVYSLAKPVIIGGDRFFTLVRFRGRPAAGHPVAEVRCMRDLSGLSWPAFQIEEGGMMALENVRIFSCGSRLGQAHTRLSFHGETGYWRETTGAVVMGGHSFVLLDHSVIAMSSANGILMAPAFADDRRLPYTNLTLVLQNDSRIFLANLHGIDLSYASKVSITLDNSSIFGAELSGIQALKGMAVEVRLDHQSSIRDCSGAHGVHIDEGVSLIVDHGSYIERASRYGVFVEELTSLEAWMRWAMFKPWIIINGSSSISNNAAGGLRSRSPITKVIVDQHSSISHNGGHGIDLSAERDEAFTALNGVSIISNLVGGIVIHGLHSGIHISKTVVKGNQDGIIVRAKFFEMRLEDSLFQDNALCSVRLDSFNTGSFWASRARFVGGMSGILARDMLKLVLESVVIESTSGAAISVTTHFFFTSNVLISHAGIGIDAAALEWNGSGVQISSSMRAVSVREHPQEKFSITNFMTVHLSGLKLLGNMLGVSCVGNVSGEIDGHIYFSTNFDIGDECRHADIIFPDFTSRLPPYATLMTMVSAVFVATVSSAILLPLVCVQRDGFVRRAVWLLAVLALGLWGIALGPVMMLSTAFSDEPEVVPLLRKWQLQTACSSACAILGSVVTYTLVMRRVSVFLEEQVSKALEMANDCEFPVVLMRSSVLLQCGELPNHEDARSQGALRFLDTVEKALTFFEDGTTSARSHQGRGALSVFFSHQWTSYTKPDPDLAQYRVMCQAIQKLAGDERCSLDDFYVWVDYFSIPQENKHAQKLAINSLPIYASLLHMFVIVAPPVVHADTGVLCDKETYQRRGWCRAEQLCHWASRGTDNIYLADDQGIFPLEESFAGMGCSMVHLMMSRSSTTASPKASSNASETARKRLGGRLCASLCVNLRRSRLQDFAQFEQSQDGACTSQSSNGAVDANAMGAQTLCASAPGAVGSTPSSASSSSSAASFGKDATPQNSQISSGPSPELSGWFAQAIYVFGEDAEYSCCRMLHRLPDGQAIPCDRIRLMLPMLGTYADIYASRNDNRCAFLFKFISRHCNSVFPSHISVATDWYRQEQVLFGDLVHRLERRLDGSKASARAAMISWKPGRGIFPRRRSTECSTPGAVAPAARSAGLGEVELAKQPPA